VRRARKTVLRTVFSAERAKPRRRSRPYPGSGRFRRPYPVLLGQSGKARSGRAGGGLALFLDPPRYPGGPRRTGMGGGCAGGAVWRVGRGSPRHGRWAANGGVNPALRQCRHIYGIAGADPDKHGFTTRSAVWPRSSIHQDIRFGRADAG